MNLRNPLADREMAHHAASLLRMVPPPPESIIERTRHALSLLLPVGKATLEGAGGNLGVKPRGLQRQLMLVVYLC